MKNQVCNFEHLFNDSNSKRRSTNSGEVVAIYTHEYVWRYQMIKKTKPSKFKIFERKRDLSFSSLSPVFWFSRFWCVSLFMQIFSVRIQRTRLGSNYSGFSSHLASISSIKVQYAILCQTSFITLFICSFLLISSYISLLLEKIDCKYAESINKSDKNLSPFVP